MGSDADKESTLNVDQLINLSLYPETRTPRRKSKIQRKKRKRKPSTASTSRRSHSGRSASLESTTGSIDAPNVGTEGRESSASMSSSLKYDLFEFSSYVSVSVKLPEGINPRELTFRFADEPQEIRITGRNFELPIWLNRPDVIVSQTAYHVVGLQLDTLELQVPKVMSRPPFSTGTAWYPNSYEASQYAGIQGSFQGPPALAETSVPSASYFSNPDPSQQNYATTDGAAGDGNLPN